MKTTKPTKKTNPVSSTKGPNTTSSQSRSRDGVAVSKFPLPLCEPGLAGGD